MYVHTYVAYLFSILLTLTAATQLTDFIKCCGQTQENNGEMVSA